MLKKEIVITSAYITLAQLLKFANVIDSGGQAKDFLAKNTILINNEPDNRRGRKLMPGDQIVINHELYLTLKK
ncbi:MAG: S4 domain-containing protein YaaA [Mycoplasmoidaceae bacterium]